MDLVTDLDRWTIRLHSGSEIEVWASGQLERNGDTIFGALVTAAAEEQRHLDVVGHSASDSERVMICLTRLRTIEIESVRSVRLGQ